MTGIPILVTAEWVQEMAIEIARPSLSEPASRTRLRAIKFLMAALPTITSLEAEDLLDGKAKLEGDSDHGMFYQKVKTQKVDYCTRCKDFRKPGECRSAFRRRHAGHLNLIVKKPLEEVV